MGFVDAKAQLRRFAKQVTQIILAHCFPHPSSQMILESITSPKPKGPAAKAHKAAGAGAAGSKSSGQVSTDVDFNNFALMGPPGTGSHSCEKPQQPIASCLLLHRENHVRRHRGQGAQGHWSGQDREGAQGSRIGVDSRIRRAKPARDC